MTDKITLITATGGRPEAFSLLEQYICRQCYTGELQWLVVDDCMPKTSMRMNQEVVPVPWLWRSGDNTQAANMLAMLPYIQHDKVLIIEDDEYYGPDYLETMSRMLDYYQLAGEGDALFYNVRFRRYWRHGNRAHACFSRTAFRREFLPFFKGVLDLYLAAGKFDRDDVNMWQGVKASTFSNRVFCPAAPLSIGIKGLPGRWCINGQHDHVSGRYMHDPALDYLTAMIGEDAENYRGYMIQ